MINLIEQKRKEKRLTIKEFCKKIGINPREYHYIKSGKIKLFKKTTLNILKVCGIEEISKDMLSNI